MRSSGEISSTRVGRLGGEVGDGIARAEVLAIVLESSIAGPAEENVCGCFAGSYSVISTL